MQQYLEHEGCIKLLSKLLQHGQVKYLFINMYGIMFTWFWNILYYKKMYHHEIHSCYLHHQVDDLQLSN